MGDGRSVVYGEWNPPLQSVPDGAFQCANHLWMADIVMRVKEERTSGNAGVFVWKAAF